MYIYIYIYIREREREKSEKLCMKVQRGVTSSNLTGQS